MEAGGVLTLSGRGLQALRLAVGGGCAQSVIGDGPGGSRAAGNCHAAEVVLSAKPCAQPCHDSGFTAK
jgi:hypothetical protein